MHEVYQGRMLNSYLAVDIGGRFGSPGTGQVDLKEQL